MRSRGPDRRREARGNRRTARRACTGSGALNDDRHIEALLDAWVGELVGRGEHAASLLASDVPESLRPLLDVALLMVLGDWYASGRMTSRGQDDVDTFGSYLPY
jgi:hypothetical protein